MSDDSGKRAGAGDGDPAASGEPVATPGLRLTDSRLRHLGRPFLRSRLTTTGLWLGVAATRVAQAWWLAHIAGQVLGRGGPVGPALVAIALVTIIRGALVWLGERSATATTARVRRALRSTLLADLVRLGPGYLVRRRTGTVETALVDGVERLADYYGRFLPMVMASTVTVTAVVVWIAVLDPVAALAMAAAALLVPAAPVLTARAFGETARTFSQSLGLMASEYLDAIQGMLTLKAFGATERWGHRLAAKYEDLSADATSLAGIANMHVGFVSLGMAGGTVLGVALATVGATHQAVSGPALLAILFLARECFRPLGELQAAFPAAYQAVAGANGVFDLLDAAALAPQPDQQVTVNRNDLIPTVDFEAVTFTYQDDRPAALDQVSFSVAAGETVALVGPSGAGKSTIVSLLLRFFDPQSGTVRIGGHDVRHLGRADMRSLVAVTFQDTYLFHRSIRDNLLLARPDASPAQIHAAAVAANAHDFIAGFPDGYDTIVGERGTRLSGGQRQRLAIARALLAGAPILILDEPTSSVDAVSETLITEALARLTGTRTTLIIAHRLSTLQRADRIIVLERGRIVQTGPLDQLRDGAGLPAHLVEAQGVR